MSRIVETRAWRPGDPQRCTYAKSAPELLPCSEPVQVNIHEFIAVTHLGPKPRRQPKAMCANHAGGRKPGERVARAEQAAAAELLRTHDAEYKQLIQIHLATAGAQGLPI